MQVPRVSVIVPTYNRSGVVVEAIRSVLGQGMNDLELIVVDDGSTDDTRQVVSSIPDPRIRYHHKANGGPAAARNAGLELAAGDYIAFLDSDDYWPVDYLATMFSALSEHPGYGLAYASIVLLDKMGQVHKVRTHTHACRTGWVTQDLFCTGFVSPVAVLIRREVLSDLRFDELLRTAEDSDFFLRLSLRTRFLYVPKLVVYTRSSHDSICLREGLNYNRLISLERFYWKSGGKEHVPFNRAAKKLSNQYRKVAKEHEKRGHKKAALCLYQKAMRYRPFDVRLYIGWTRSLLIFEDKQPRWQWPSELSQVFV